MNGPEYYLSYDSSNEYGTFPSGASGIEQVDGVSGQAPGLWPGEQSEVREDKARSAGKAKGVARERCLFCCSRQINQHMNN